MTYSSRPRPILCSRVTRSTKSTGWLSQQANAMRARYLDSHRAVQAAAQRPLALCPRPPPPNPPWPSPPPPPAATVCGCSHYLDGITPTSLASDVCVKRESTRVMCRPRAYHLGAQQCNPDMEPCAAGQDDQDACADAPGRWAMRKCAKKLSKGKCRKRRFAQLCRRTCGACALG